MIRFETGLYFNGKDAYTPRWAIIISLFFVVGLSGYVIYLFMHLFQDILNINTYWIKVNKDLINNATIPDGVDLFPFELSTKYFCKDTEVTFYVEDTTRKMERVPGLSNLTMDC